MPPPRENSTYIRSLTGLRYFAALGVVIHHCLRPFRLEDPAPWISVALGSGVSFFFILSGFVLTLSLRGKPPANFPDYYFRRMARVVPLYWFAAVFAIVALLANGRWKNNTDGFTVLPGGTGTALGLHFSMLQSWIPLPDYPTCFNGPAWSLSVEALFYVVFPFCLLVSARWFAGIALAAVAAIWTTTVFLSTTNPAFAPANNLLLVHMFPPTRLAEFFAGIVAARIFLWNPRPVPISWLWTALALAAIGFWSSQRGYLSGLLVPSLGTSAKMLIFQCGGLFFFTPAIYLLARVEAHGNASNAVIRFLSSPPMQLLGNASFAMYLLHIPLRLAIPGYYYRVAGTLWVYLLAVHVLSIATYYLFETPARRALLRLIPRQPKPGDPVPVVNPSA